jgi:predicted regulator of Ras-like GTPase activity (Roadblock/LC7/MglB family)
MVAADATRTPSRQSTRTEVSAALTDLFIALGGRTAQELARGGLEQVLIKGEKGWNPELDDED